MCIHVCSGEAKKISLGGQFKSNKIIKGRIRVLLAFERAMGWGNGLDEIFYHTKFIIFGYFFFFINLAWLGLTTIGLVKKFVQTILKSYFSRGASDKIFV